MAKLLYDDRTLYLAYLCQDAHISAEAIESLSTRDLYRVRGSVMMASTVLILGNLIADILLALSDPRIRVTSSDG